MRLGARARALGMVPAGSPAFLRLQDGTVLGVAAAAKAPPAPTVTAKPTASPTGQKKQPTEQQPTKQTPTKQTKQQQTKQQQDTTGRTTGQTTGR
ncbi:hypothetical protein GCM10025868_06800 [Angustibacter aerolatus]|uniref:Uncharacterized protein n=1 Tax=Angustibacter aerolatus TaxID=1162965 RepID=A0ABQ6JE07_9ACTN|nr:hypothetical protein GCM10025868_06800 [Angustibacter aerolatus]